MEIPIRVVLVETSHPGNIGACARAMKTMGLTDLVLVRPRQFPHAEASAMASGADDLLVNARVCDTLAEALGECSLAIATSARSRTLAWTNATPRQAAVAMHTHSVAAAARQLSLPAAAIVMGPEKTGLTNEDLARCGMLVQIPANPRYSSLNLAMAVQVLCYELRVAWLESSRSEDDAAERAAATDTAREAPPATATELEGLHEHMERVLTSAGFLHPDHPHQLKLKLRRLFHRASLDRDEINILRGMLSALDPDRRNRTG
jgi:tRNA (cytidine32/uridine32-2'-O)-methyltransferase